MLQIKTTKAFRYKSKQDRGSEGRGMPVGLPALPGDDSAPDAAQGRVILD